MIEKLQETTPLWSWNYHLYIVDECIIADSKYIIFVGGISNSESEFITHLQIKYKRVALLSQNRYNNHGYEHDTYKSTTLFGRQEDSSVPHKMKAGYQKNVVLLSGPS